MIDKKAAESVQMIRTKNKIFTNELTYKEYECKNTNYRFYIYKLEAVRAEESFKDSLIVAKQEGYDELLLDEKDGNAGKRSMCVLIAPDDKIKVLNLDGKVFESYEFKNSDSIIPFFDQMDRKIKKTYRVKQNLEELKLLKTREVELTKVDDDNYIIEGYGNIKIFRDKTLEEFNILKERLIENNKITSNSNISICYKSLNGARSFLFLFVENRIINVTLENFKQLFKVRELLIKNGL